MDKFSKTFYLPIQKIDDEERMVFGWASTPDIDSDGEVIKAEALEKALPDYMKFPTIREMHQPKAIGKTKQAEVTNKGLYIGAKIVDDNAWKMVKEGVFTSFSVGGNVVKRVGKVIQEMDLIEISLVDVPANKAAVIELWKRGKVNKNASTAYSMANLMIQVKDAIYYMDYYGKDTKKLNRCLEMLKEVLATEAMEPEETDEDKEKGRKLFDGKTSAEIEQKISIMRGITLNNVIAESLRKGVILAMEEKKKELKKVEEAKADETTAEESTTEATEAEETTETATVETTETEETAEGEKAKETGAVAAALKKVEAITAKLTPKKEEVKKTDDVAKAVGSLAGGLAKIADALESVVGRIARLEAQPAATKSKAVVVQKTIGGAEGKTEDADGEGEKPELVAKQARLAELEKLHDELGKAEFGRRGLSMEAMRLKNEIAALSK